MTGPPRGDWGLLYDTELGPRSKKGVEWAIRFSRDFRILHNSFQTQDPELDGDIERIADYGANIAKRAIALSQTPPVKPVHAIPRMARLVQAMIKDVLDAYLARDADKALDVWERDEEVDEMYTSLFRELLTYMMEDPRHITPCTHLLFIAKNIERIGDHATNIAETIHYIVTGERMEGGRPKGDSSSFQVVKTPEEEIGADSLAEHRGGTA